MITLHGKEIKVGDKVWDFLSGWSEVVTLGKNSFFPINTNITNYSSEGMHALSQKFPRLFWQEFEIPAHAFEKQKVMVKKYFVLFKCNGEYNTTSNWRENNRFKSKKEFDAAYNTLVEFKFISLILESEIEVEE